MSKFPLFVCFCHKPGDIVLLISHAKEELHLHYVGVCNTGSPPLYFFKDFKRRDS